MHLPTPLLIALSSLLTITTSTPVHPRAAPIGTPHNIYLSTCTTRSLLSDSTLSSAILYTGPASSTSPTDIGTVSSSRAIQWAGFTRRVDLESGVFESKISQSADTFAKSELAGSATLSGTDGGKEEFVCFRDGVSTFRFGSGVVGDSGETTVCVAEFWCASVGV